MGSLTTLPAATSPAETPGEKPAAPAVSLPPLKAEPLAPAMTVPVPLIPAAASSVKPPAASEPEKTSATPEPVPVASIPRRQFVNPFERPAAPMPVEAKAEPEPAATASVPAASQPEPVAETPKPETVGDGLVAVSGPAPWNPSTRRPRMAEESDDVKKRKTPKSAPPAPERSGLILIPPAADKPTPGRMRTARSAGPRAAAHSGRSQSRAAGRRAHARPLAGDENRVGSEG